MEFSIETWPVEKLIALYMNQGLNLNPPYQRNPIWTEKAQKSLIESIKLGFPLPNFFLFKAGENSYEMVDGQQRTRAILLFRNSNDLDTSDSDIKYKEDAFLKYSLSVTVITKIRASEYIEDFYDRVNSSGLRLNRPEKLKARYFDSRFLDLVEKLVQSQEFQELKLVPPNSRQRMLDRDLVEELAALALHGITDKKEQVDKIYKSDIEKPEARTIDLTFEKVIKIINKMTESKPISTTRYRQRNDFYTLFGFIKNNSNLDEEQYTHFYKILIGLERGIRPNRNRCKPLYEYAFRCVSQSNSSQARAERAKIFESILINNSNSPNETQQAIIDYYSLPANAYIESYNNYTFDPDILTQHVSKVESSALEIIEDEE